MRWGGLPTIAWHAISTAAPLLHVTTHLPDFLFAELELPGMLTVCTNTTEPMSQYDTNQSQIRLSQAVRKIRELIHIITYIYIYLFYVGLEERVRRGYVYANVQGKSILRKATSMAV